MKYLPLTLEMIINSNNLYLTLCYLRRVIDRQVSNFSAASKTSMHYLKVAAAKDLYEDIGVSRQTWSKIKHELPQPPLYNIVDQHVVQMPFEVWDIIEQKLSMESMNRRVSLLRVYCYMYFQDTFYHNEFQRPQDAIAIELHTSTNIVNRALQTFINWGWLVRKGRFKFTGKDTFAYRHVVSDYMKPIVIEKYVDFI